MEPLYCTVCAATQAPATERWSHYAQAWMEHQFDAVVHLDKTRAVTALLGDPQVSLGRESACTTILLRVSYVRSTPDRVPHLQWSSMRAAA